MNYIDQINFFWSCNKEHCFNPSEIALYFHLLDVSNSLGWKNPFKQGNMLISATIGMSEPTIQRSREKLVKSGLILFKSGKVKRELTEYVLIEGKRLGKQFLHLTLDQSDTQSSTLSDTLNGVTPFDINKQNETKPLLMCQANMGTCSLKKDSSDYKVYESSIKLYNGFVKAFPENKDLPLKTLLEWITPIRLLMEKKKYTYDQIREVATWAIEDNFWRPTIIDSERLAKHFEGLKIKYKESCKETLK